MRVLALDPSSSKTGYALMTSLLPGGLEDAGLLVPSSSKRVATGAAEACEADVAAWFAEGELAACRRMVETFEDVWGLYHALKPDRVVVEVSSGKAGTGSKRGAKSSLAVYGMAAGGVWSLCRALAPGRVVPVTERMWTRDAGSKRARAALAASVYAGRYQVADDKGFDVADAIGIGRWYLRRSMELCRLPAAVSG
jgi:hypothetical protein